MSPAVSLYFTRAKKGLVTHLTKVVHDRRQAGSYWLLQAGFTRWTPSNKSNLGQKYVRQYRFSPDFPKEI